MTKISKEDDSDVTRLFDILVEEVSLVDRAANKRNFLVMKRSEKAADGLGAELVKNADGTYAQSQPSTDEDPADVPAQAEPQKISKSSVYTTSLSTLLASVEQLDAGIKAEEVGDGPLDYKILDLAYQTHTWIQSVLDHVYYGVKPTEKASEDITKSFPQHEQMAYAALTSLMHSDLTEVATKASAAGDDAWPDAWDVSKLVCASYIIDGLIARASIIGGETVEKSEAATEDAVPAEATDADQHWARFTKSETAADETLAALQLAASTIKPRTPSEKSGAKMASNRLSKLTNTVVELLDLLRDTSPEAFDALMATVTKSASEVTTAEVPVVATAPEAPSAEDLRVAALEAQLATSAEALKKRNEKISSLSKSFDLPNSVIVDGLANDAQGTLATSTSWPMDMNSPVTPETVKKGLWF